MTLEQVQNEIIAECSALGDRIEMYEYLIAWGDRLEPIDERYKTKEYLVPGCQSATWVAIEVRDGLVQHHIDSDAKITRGMMALILRVINGQTPEEIMKTDLFFIDRIGLRSNLSPARVHGLNAVIGLIRDRVREKVGRETGM